MPFLFEGLPKGSSTTQARKETAEETEHGAAKWTTSPHRGPGGGAPDTGSPLPLEEPRCFHRFYYYFLRPTDPATEKMAHYSFQEEVARLRGGRGDGERTSVGRKKKMWAGDFLVASGRVKQVRQGRQV